MTLPWSSLGRTSPAVTLAHLRPFLLTTAGAFSTNTPNRDTSHEVTRGVGSELIRALEGRRP